VSVRQDAIARGSAGVARSAAFAPLVLYAPAALALVLWAVGLTMIDVGRMNDLGLVSVMPPHIFAAVAILTISAGYQIQRDRVDGRILAVHLVALVFVLYAIPPIVEETARTSVTWAHLGFAEYITRTGTTAPTLEARFNWPGFFIGAAFISSLAGAATLTALAEWAPVYFNLLFLLPLGLIARGLTADARLVWASLWLFEITNWIGQDYFSPQALAYFMYLVIVAVIVTWFLVRQPRSDAIVHGLDGSGRGGVWLRRLYSALTPENDLGQSLSRSQQVAMIGLLVVVFAYVSYSHQLTPFFTVAALMALLIFNRITLRSVPILFGVMAVAWVSYMTVPFLQGHVVSMIKEIGSVGDTLTTNVTSRIAGSIEHQTVVTLRLAFTLALWAVAGLGALIRFRDGRRDLTLVLFAAAPVPLIALQAYGGELVLRLYLFSLPFVAILVAGVVYGRRPTPPGALLSAATVAVTLVIAFGFLVVRYGNERTDVMTESEVATIQELYRIAPAGSLLVAASNNLPWKFEKFEQYDYVPVFDEGLIGDLGAIANIMADPKYPHAYLILTRSQGTYAEVFTGLPPGAWDRFVADANASPALKVVFRDQDSEILVLAGRTGQGTAR
jgi:hypothetical protein